MTEQRQRERVLSRAKVSVKDYIQGKTRSYDIVDLSSTGVFLKTRRPRTVGETVLLHYPMPGSKRSQRIEAEVVRVVDTHSARKHKGVQAGMGLNFLRAFEA